MSDEKDIPAEENPKEQPPGELHSSYEPVSEIDKQNVKQIETLSLDNAEIIEIKNVKENMEVHKHPHHITHKKKWGEYLLEFFMLFLAVFLGFIAENIREHSVERNKEKEYIKSMVEDLETDSAFLELSVNKLIPYHLTWLDSTMHLLKMPDLKGKDRLVYQAFMIGTGWSYNFHPTERTLSQLHSEGYHLIRNKNAANSISQLEQQYKQFNLQIEPFVESMQNDIDLSAYLFADRVITDSISRTAMQNFSDAYTVQLKLEDIPALAVINTANKEGIKLYNDKLKKYSFYLQYGITGGHVVILREIKNTIQTLKKEYNLEDE